MPFEKRLIYLEMWSEVDRDFLFNSQLIIWANH